MHLPVPYDPRSPDHWVESFKTHLHKIDNLAFAQQSPIYDIPRTPEFAHILHGFCTYSPKRDSYYIHPPNIVSMVERALPLSTLDFPRMLGQLMTVTTVRTARAKAYYFRPPRIHLRNYTETLDDDGVPDVVKRTLRDNRRIRTLHRNLVRAQMRGKPMPQEDWVELDLFITQCLAQVVFLEQQDDMRLAALVNY